jgi:putative oxidoreductase
MVRRDLGLLWLRVGIGGLVAAHGAQKLFGAFGGNGIEGTARSFEANGFQPGRPHALAAGLGELVGGGALALGLATPAAAATVAGTMAVAASSNAHRGFFNAKGGLEFPGSLAVGAASLALLGPGRLSLDRALGNRLARGWMGPLSLALAGAGAVLIARRRRSVLARTAVERLTAPAERSANGSTPNSEADGTTSAASQRS